MAYFAVERHNTRIENYFTNKFKFYSFDYDDVIKIKFTKCCHLCFEYSKLVWHIYRELNKM